MRCVPTRMSTSPATTRSSVFFLVGGSHEARHLRDAHREFLEPLAEGVVMLLGENCRRREEGDLLAAHDCLEGGAHRDFGLSIADVAAHEPVHRHGLFHVGLDLGDDRQLVLGFFVGKGCLEGGLPFGVFRIREALCGLAPRIEVDQALRDILDRFLYFVLAVFPGLRAEPVEPGAVAFVADVALDEIHLLDRDEDGFLVGVLEFDVVAFVAERLYPLDTLELSDTVIDVDNVIAGIELDEGIDDRALGVLDRFRYMAAAAENLVFLDNENFEFGESEARRQVERNDVDLDVLENLADAKRLVLAFGEHADFPVVLEKVRELFLEVDDVAEKNSAADRTKA